MTRQKGVSIKATDKDIKENPYCQDVKLTVGTPVMSCCNVKLLDIVNNEAFEVIKIENENENEGSITLKSKLKNNVIKWSFKDFNKFFVVAHAITVHKSQGQTFNFKFMIHETHLMSKRMLYTALTRTTDKNLIHIVKSKTIEKCYYSNEFYNHKIQGYNKQDAHRHKTNDLHIQDLKEIVSIYDNKCYNCGKELNEKTITFDRQNDQKGHTKENLKLCCLHCNTKKPNNFIA